MGFLTDAINILNRPEYLSDTERIVKVAFANGYTISLKQAEAAWEAYSDSMAAGWMRLPEDDEELWNILR